MNDGTAPAETLDQRSLNRAFQALRCLPFRRAFYEALVTNALSAGEIASAGDSCSRSQLSASAVETHLIWLIQLGVLRREVDGQGLTQRVRLTPMGLMLLKRIQAEIPPADLISKLHHWIRRHWPRG
jgi:DNA-binding transcriptional ArsR family regulator